MVGDDKALVIQQLKAMGLTDAEATEVANAINTATGTLTDGVYSLYDTIYQKLTDGATDTPDQTTALQKSVQDYYDTLIAGINLNTETQLANLKIQLENGFISAEEYQIRADAITAKNGELITSVQKTCTNTLTLVADMSGKSTTEVQEALGKIEDLKAQALAEAAAIEKLAEQAQSAEGKTAQTLVKSGAKVDEETANLAFDTAYNQKQVDTYGVEQTSKAKQAEINQAYQSAYGTKQAQGASADELKALTEQRDAMIQEELGKLEEQKQKIMDVYTQTFNELMQGLGESNPVLKDSIDNALKNVDIYEEITSALEKLLSGTPPTDLQLSEEAKTLFKNWFTFDFDSFNWSDTVFGTTQMTILLTEAKTALHDEIMKIVNPDENDPLATDFGIMGQVYARMAQEGMLEGIQGATPPEGGDDTSFAKALLETLTGDVGSTPLEVPVTVTPVAPEGTDNQSEISAYLDTLLIGAAMPGEGESRTVDVPVTVSPDLTVEEDTQQKAIDALRDSLTRGEMPEGEGASSASVTVPVTVTPDPVSDAGAGQAMVSVLADAITAGEGTAAIASTGLATAAAGPLAGLAGSSVLAGINAVQGLINGAESKRSPLISKFKSLATAAYQAVKDVLHINSPSKVFEALGSGTVEGYVKGVDDNARLAQDATRRMALLSAAGPTTITGAGTTAKSSIVNNYNNGAPVSVTYTGDIHMESDAEMRAFERKQQRIARDLQYGLGVRKV